MFEEMLGQLDQDFAFDFDDEDGDDAAAMEELLGAGMSPSMMAKLMRAHGPDGEMDEKLVMQMMMQDPEFMAAMSGMPPGCASSPGGSVAMSPDRVVPGMCCVDVLGLGCCAFAVRLLPVFQ